MTSATAEPSPPTIEWFSRVMTPCLARRIDARIAGSVKGLCVDTWTWVIPTPARVSGSAARIASSVVIPAVKTVTSSPSLRMRTRSSRIGSFAGNRRGTSPRSIRM